MPFLKSIFERRTIMNKEDKKIDSIKPWEAKEKAEKADPDLKYDSPNDSHTAIIKRLRHFGKYRGNMYSKVERKELIKMIQEKNYIALFMKYFEAQIWLTFYGERLSMDDGWEVGNVQGEIMCSVPIDFRQELFDRLKESVEEGTKWWFKGYLKLREERKTKEKIMDILKDEDKTWGGIPIGCLTSKVYHPDLRGATMWMGDEYPITRSQINTVRRTVGELEQRGLVKTMLKPVGTRAGYRHMKVVGIPSEEKIKAVL